MLDCCVSVANVAEIVDLGSGKEHAGGQTVDGCISPLVVVSFEAERECENNDMTYSFHPEATRAIHHIEEIFILLTSEPVQPRDLEVTPEMTHVIVLLLAGQY